LLNLSAGYKCGKNIVGRFKNAAEAIPHPLPSRPASSGLRFEGLDALRGIGAPLVVYGHYTLMVRPFGESFLWHTSAYLLVDVFFILSGFVLAHAFFDKANFDFWEFTKKRVFRLWPVHMVTLTAMILLLVLAGDPVYKKGVALNVLMLHNIGIGGHPMVWINPPSWSLSVEFVTNLVVGGLVLAIPDRRLNSIILSGLCVASATILFFTVDNLDTAVANVHGFINTGMLRGTFTLTMGILAYRFYIANRLWFERTSLLRTGIVGVLLTFFFVSLFAPGGEIETDLLYLVTYTLLILAMANPGPFWMPIMLQFRFLATISFALYMVHMFVLRLMLEVQIWTYNYYTGLFVAFALSIPLAALIHFQVERPCYAWMTRRWSAKAPVKAPAVIDPPAPVWPIAVKDREAAS
jgi:peptidoglycan/LPS O-acetylase OafA/YrhL